MCPTPTPPPPLPPFTKWGSASYLWPFPRVHAKPSKVEKSKIQRSARSKMLQKLLNLTFNHNQPAESLAGWAGQITFLFLNAKIKKSIIRIHDFWPLIFFFFLDVSTIHWLVTESTDATDWFSWLKRGHGRPGEGWQCKLPSGLRPVPGWATQTFKIKGQTKTETKQNLKKKKKGIYQAKRIGWAY